LTRASSFDHLVGTGVGWVERSCARPNTDGAFGCWVSQELDPTYEVGDHHVHSITSSAATSSLSGTVRPTTRAAWALITSSNLDACTTGRSAGLAPFRMRPV